jgi:hypothetical protein
MNNVYKVAVAMIAILLVLSACGIDDRTSHRYKVTIDDGDEFTPSYIFFVYHYQLRDGGAFCYMETVESAYTCYQKSVNESIEIEFVVPE